MTTHYFVFHVPHDCWCNAGMASAAVQARLKRIGQGVLEPAQGLTALRAILKLQNTATSGAVSQVAVNPFIWDSYIPQLPLSRQQFFADFASDVATLEQASKTAAESPKAVSLSLGSILSQVLNVLESIVGGFLIPLSSISSPHHCSLYIQVQHILPRYLHNHLN